MNEIDDILDFLNIDSWDSPSAEKNPVCEEKPETEDIPTIQSEGIPDEDLDNILLDNGFVITEGVEEEPTMDVQERQEEVEDENIDIEDDLSESNTYSNDKQTEDATVENNEDSSLLIKPNSPTLVMDDSSSRFSGTEWYNEITKQRIILAGLGGIGSWTALQLARMCPASMFLYDDDIVESANMSGQLYSLDDIGISKVDAISKMIKSYTSTLSIFSINQKFTSNTETGNIMICGFDNMEARRVFFNAWQKHVESKSPEERKLCLYLDGIIKCLSDNL